MIDSVQVHFLNSFGIEGDDLQNSFTSGFIPADPQIRSAHARTAPSLNPLSAVAPDEAFFVGTDVHGRRFYSRNGDFRLAEGRLQTENGSTVMGYAPGGTTLVPLQIDPKDVALGRAASAQIETDGSLTYTRPLINGKTGEKQSERVVVGRVALARFAAGTDVPRLIQSQQAAYPVGSDSDSKDGVHFTAPAGLAPTIGKPNELGFRPLQTHRVDRGNLNMALAVKKLSDEYMEYAAFKTAGDAKGKNESEVLALLK